VATRVAPTAAVWLAPPGTLSASDCLLWTLHILDCLAWTALSGQRALAANWLPNLLLISTLVCLAAGGSLQLAARQLQLSSSAQFQASRLARPTRRLAPVVFLGFALAPL